MIYHPLGRSDLSISAIGFGCMSLGQDEAENTRIIERAIGLGINFFDTADIYEKGLNEEKIGRILKGKREQVLIASKVGNVAKPEGSSHGGGSGQGHGSGQRGGTSPGSAFDWDPSPEHIRRSIEGTLKRLGTDRIDLYQLHGGTMEDRFDETIDAFERLREQGKIRYYGISSIRPAVIGEYVRRASGGIVSPRGENRGIVSPRGESRGIVSAMMQYSLLDRRPDEAYDALGGKTCLEFLREHGVGVLARGSLAKGLLVDKEPTVSLEYDAQEVGAAASAIRMISGASRNPAQTALQYVLQHPAVSCAVVGFRTMKQLEDVLGEASGGLETGTFDTPNSQAANTPFLPIPEQENSLLNGSIPRLRYR